MPFFLRVGHNGKAKVCETNSSTLGLDGPAHKGKIWLNGDVICLQFPSIDNITVGGRAPLQIVSHMVRFKADEKGIMAAKRSFMSARK